jgi:hypothetical protein
MHTTASGFPYPDGTDLVRDGDDVIRALAEAIEAKLMPTPWANLTPLGVGYSARSGYHVPSYEVYPDGKVRFRGGLTKSSAIVSGETVFTLPTNGRPTVEVEFPIGVARTGTTNDVVGRIKVTPAGAATVFVIDSEGATSISIDGGGCSK